MAKFFYSSLVLVMIFLFQNCAKRNFDGPNQSASQKTDSLSIPGADGAEGPGASQCANKDHDDDGVSDLDDDDDDNDGVEDLDDDDHDNDGISDDDDDDADDDKSCGDVEDVDLDSDHDSDDGYDDLNHKSDGGEYSSHAC
ncbi:MAG: hypothetical protein AB7H97_20530 [Pseudobdellovibrionaceae bacterium]